MASSETVSVEPVFVTRGAAGVHSTKYRLSCDRCQNTKVRCSQDKPACQRCRQKAVSCVYSPLRRIGRPKKGTRVTLDESSESMLAASESSRASYATSTTTPDDSYCQTDFARADIQIQDETQVADSSQHIIAQTIDREEKSDPASNTSCYTTILTQTAKLVQTQEQKALPLSIDLVLEAEHDFFLLQRQLFVCTGHQPAGFLQDQQQGNHDSNFISHSEQNNNDTVTHRACLASDRLILLSLAILAEHVTSLLESIFHLAAQAAHALDKTTADLSGDQDDVLSGPSARRLQRSCRSFWANPCVSPLVEASRDLRLGDFLVENPAKSKAMRSILMLRVERMLRVLQDMERSRKHHTGQSNRVNGGGPLDWGGSVKLMSDQAYTLVNDLIRRVESLQGAMVLIRNDSMI